MHLDKRHLNLNFVFNLFLYEITYNLLVVSNELILAGKLQLKKLQKKKPEKNSGFDGA